MTVRVFRSDDVGAPVSSNVVGSMINILDYCLVSGSGWTKSYSGTNIAVYKSPAGVSKYLRVDDSVSTQAYITGFTSMSDINTGICQFPSTTQIPTGLTLVRANAAAARPWMMVVGATSFYLYFVDTSAASNSLLTIPTFSTMHVYFFGEYIPSYGTKSYPMICGMAAAQNTTGRFAAPFDFTASFMGGNPVTKDELVSTPYALSSTYNGVGNIGSGTVNASGFDPINSGIPLTSISVSVQQTNSTGLGTYKVGRMPGIYAQNYLRAYFDTFTLKNDVTRSFLTMPIQSGAAMSAAAVETTSNQTW